MPEFGRKSFRLLILIFALCFVALSTPVAADDLRDVLVIPPHSEWAFWAQTQPPAAWWRKLNFDDVDWSRGDAGFGYGDDDDVTALPEMRGQHASVFVRRSFSVSDPKVVKRLFLHINYDDAFVAWLNGTRVASANVSGTQSFAVVDHHEAGDFEIFDIPNASELLRPGTNVLAIEGHNVDIDSSDFTLDPFLATKRIDAAIDVLQPHDFLADLAEFRRRLEDQSSYLTLRQFNYSAELELLRRSIDQSMTPSEFTLALWRFVMRLGDCHASVRSDARLGLTGFLPVRLGDTEDGIVALKLNADELVNTETPYLESIDGIPLARWLRQASLYVPAGSTQLVRHRSMEALALFDLLRRDLNVTVRRVATLRLVNNDGSAQHEIDLRLTSQQFSVMAVQPKASRRLDQNLGYLRIAAMDRRLVEPLVERMIAFQDTAGLIIDVRGNGGGTYDVLHALYPFFQSPTARSYVTNIAAYRLSDQFDENHIAYRPTHRFNWSGWNADERTAIASAFEKFQPAFRFPPEQFSDWHFMLLSRRQSELRNRQWNIEYFHYTKPVVVLCDARSFSATDGFLSAFADLPQVTLMGEASGGGSGATRGFRLPRTEVRIRLSSMASFRPNGSLFDGQGIGVDVERRPTIDDVLRRTDSVLEEARRILRVSK